MDILYGSFIDSNRTKTITTSKYYNYIICIATGGGRYSESGSVYGNITVSNKTITDIVNIKQVDTGGKTRAVHYHVAYVSDVPDGTTVTVSHFYEGMEVVIGIY